MTYTKSDLVDWLYQSLKKNGGKGMIVELCKIIWQDHEQDLRESSDLFYTWQYDVRWAANELHRGGKIDIIKRGTKSVWVLK